jgi:RNA recognition motif-containing protein
MRIMVGNLPDDITEETIREALSDVAPVNAIKLVPEGGAPSVMIEMEMSRADAEALARRIHGRIHEGRELRAWAPLCDWK